MTAVKIGLVGAGPWANLFHAPMITGGPETELTAVWARRAEAAQEIATRYNSTTAPSFEALLEQVDAVVFAVPPFIQADLAAQTAAAGKPMLLEKPIGLDLPQARKLVDAIDDAGVATQVVFTNRYSPTIRTFFADAQAATPIGAVGYYINQAALPGGTFATPWRVENGALLDLGPHVLDTLDAAVGPIRKVRGEGDPKRWYVITAYHDNGVISQASMSLTSPVVADVAGVKVYTEQGELECEFVGKDGDPEVPGVIRREFAQVVTSGKSHEVDVHRALYIQQLLEQATTPA
ncbi:Gfo/Idh/MocA family oxidoreductase [Gordonia polyisoprenivorans]|uniref:Gfo/Idh/MocA family protein n=1 Tax=Gordonia polyisoprenivorans TaxID=84595 RepID=UPI001B8CFB47|nr:Gfo/Idh/MocA family oxidoreductase [Gordonia polyisoprenivorans]QUD83592.1 Gfo/Idh/MocA family oxidoreductase [Gordonia polyisoprenivorans]UZF55446.1 Gfo/Idh/MocA family oxidoreductase [Gordonia polyisoprenivorans]